MPQRIEDGNMVSFDWSAERAFVERRIKDTLATYNSGSPITLDMIMQDIDAFVATVEETWSWERVFEARRGTDAMHSALVGVIGTTLDSLNKRAAQEEGTNDA